MNRKLLIPAIVAALLLSACDHRPPPAPRTAIVQKMPREDFTKFVMGKSAVPIEAKFGKPYLDNDYAEQLGILWVYKNLTFDPATGRQDQFATIVFEHGVVTKVVFK